MAAPDWWEPAIIRCDRMLHAWYAGLITDAEMETARQLLSAQVWLHHYRRRRAAAAAQPSQGRLL